MRSTLTALPLALALSLGCVADAGGTATADLVASTYDPGFRMGSGCNEWWIEVYADAETVEVEVEGEGRTALPRTSWGAFATGRYIAPGTRVRLFAERGADHATSTWFRYLEGAPALDGSADPEACGSTYDPGFRMGSGCNEWWIEVYADADAVEVEVEGRTALPLTSWGAFAASRYTAPGTSIRLLAVRGTDRATSTWFRYLEASPSLDTSGCIVPEPAPDGGAGSPDPIPETPESYGPIVPSRPVPGAEVTLEVDVARNRRAISPHVYGTNHAPWPELGGGAVTFYRAGGNRLTAYNWENNASNAGSDWGPYANDDYLCWSYGERGYPCSSSGAPGAFVAAHTDMAFANGASAMLTVPIQGWVAADKAGNVSLGDMSRFLRSLPRKGSALSLTPSTSDGSVYQDELVHWVRSRYPDAFSRTDRRIFFSLDNEPALWSETHPEIHPHHVTYDELVTASVQYADAIKSVAPDAVVFGPALFGWSAYESLNNGTDRARYGHFAAHYLSELRRAGEARGRRLLDVFDLHWYPEARGDGQRITFGGADSTSSGIVQARVQAPRSLWDPSYREQSWIADGVGAIRLLPRIREQIAASYPGTEIAVTEYNYGGGHHVSGGIAQADVLGIWGREGVFATNYWHLGSGDDYVRGAFRMFRNFDGSHGRFGDVSVAAGSTDHARTSVYASVDTSGSGRIVLVAINKTGAPIAAGFRVLNGAAGTARVFELTSASPAPRARGDVAFSGGELVHTLPAMSVTTLEILPTGGGTGTPAPPPDPEPSPEPTYDPGFRMGTLNDWWVEVYCDAASVALETEAGARWDMSPSSWGAFTLNEHVPAGTRVRLHATRADGATASSTFFAIQREEPRLPGS